MLICPVGIDRFVAAEQTSNSVAATVGGVAGLLIYANRCKRDTSNHSAEAKVGTGAATPRTEELAMIASSENESGELGERREWVSSLQNGEHTDLHIGVFYWSREQRFAEWFAR